MNKKIIIVSIIAAVFLSTSFSIAIKPVSNFSNDDVPGPGDIIEGYDPWSVKLPGQANPNPHPQNIVERDDRLAYILDQVTEDLYLSYIENLVALGPRESGTEGVYLAADFIYNTLSEIGDLDVRYDPWHYESYNEDNIEATLSGTNPESDEIYIICAHYDTVKDTVGADDDGSGTIAVITAAKVLSNYRFEHTIKFVTFSGEEKGLLGSYKYVEDALIEGWNIGGVINLDMIGFAPNPEDTDQVRAFEGEFSQDLLDLATDVSNVYVDKIGIEPYPSGYSRGSDHYYFWEAGYPAIFFIEENFNDYYHSPSDIIEHMNIEYATDNTKLAVGTLVELAELTEYGAPNIPSIPEGPTSGEVEQEYEYTTFTTDPEGDPVYYYFDWGDGSSTGWIGPYDSGEEVSAKKTWLMQRSYEIKVKAKDIHHLETEWSDPLEIEMPKGSVNTRVFFRLLERYPIFYELIQQILKI